MEFPRFYVKNCTSMVKYKPKFIFSIFEVEFHCVTIRCNEGLIMHQGLWGMFENLFGCFENCNGNEHDCTGFGWIGWSIYICVHNRVCDSLLRWKLGYVYHSRLLKDKLFDSLLYFGCFQY